MRSIKQVLAELPEGSTLEEVKHAMLEIALEKTGGNQRKAGKLLGISRDQVRYMMRKKNRSEPSFHGNIV
jgi:two-component system response regulator AtoC